MEWDRWMCLWGRTVYVVFVVGSVALWPIYLQLVFFSEVFSGLTCKYVFDVFAFFFFFFVLSFYFRA